MSSDKVLSADVRDLEQRCRDALLWPSIFRFLTKKENAHAQVCALLDFVGDSEIALSSISRLEGRTKVEPYFLAYGALQLMYARQTALRAVLKTLGIPIPANLNDNSIVEPRDCVIGHPITSDGGAHVILRNTLDADGFEYVSYRGPKTVRGNVVTYEPLLEEHWRAMKEGLASLFRELAEIENRRRREMRKTPLLPRLQGMDYVVRCLAAATVEEKYLPMIPTHAEMLREALQDFREGLVTRFGEDDAAYRVDRVIEGTTMLQELYPFTDRRAQLRFEIVADGIECRTRELARTAREVDDTEATELS